MCSRDHSYLEFVRDVCLRKMCVYGKCVYLEFVRKQYEIVRIITENNDEGRILGNTQNENTKNKNTSQNKQKKHKTQKNDNKKI